MSPAAPTATSSPTEALPPDLAALRATAEPLFAEELAERVAQQQALAELGELAAGAADPDALLRVAVHVVARGVGADAVAFLERSAGGGFKVRASTRRELLGLEVPERGALAASALASGSPVTSDEARDDAPDLWFSAAGLRAGVCVPLSASPETASVLCGYAAGARAFRPAEIQYFRIAANILGGTLARQAALEETRRVQARLAAADRLVSSASLASSLAHELNNPLAVVSANLAYAADLLDGATRGAGLGSADAGEMRAALEDARAGAERMRDLVRDLRALARVDERDISPVALEPLLASCVRLASSELSGRARVVVEAEGVPAVHGNPARLGQVFLNLLVNAAQAIPDGNPERHEVRVTARQIADSRISVEFRDTGRGIAPDVLPRVFEPFFTTRTGAGSKGLGLPICHQIVTALGGSMEVESTPGAGTLIRVVLRLPAQRT